jgi:diguanylate cyclase (GGDEF)-like protein
MKPGPKVLIISELEADRDGSVRQAGIVAEKIRATLAEPYSLAIRREGKADTSVEHRCTASIGVALFVHSDASQEDIFRRADAAMYLAKVAGRNSIRFDTGET